MTLSDVARASGLTRATSRRFLLTLVREGYAETDGKYFRLRPRVLELGFSALSSLSVGEAAQPLIDVLSKKLNETCFVAVLDGSEVLYVASAAAKHRVAIHVPLGSRAPAYAVSTGRVLLAALPEKQLDTYLKQVTLKKLTPNTVTAKAKLKTALRQVAQQEYSLVDQELEIGLRSLSVPIRNRSGDVVAALNLCCPTVRITIEQMRSDLLTELKATSAQITAAMPVLVR